MKKKIVQKQHENGCESANAKWCAQQWRSKQASECTSLWLCLLIKFQMNGLDLPFPGWMLSRAYLDNLNECHLIFFKLIRGIWMREETPLGDTLASCVRTRPLNSPAKWYDFHCEWIEDSKYKKKTNWMRRICMWVLSCAAAIIIIIVVVAFPFDVKHFLCVFRTLDRYVFFMNACALFHSRRLFWCVRVSKHVVSKHATHTPPRIYCGTPLRVSTEIYTDTSSTVSESERASIEIKAVRDREKSNNKNTAPFLEEFFGYKFERRVA